VRRKVDISKLGTSESEYNARNGYENRLFDQAAGASVVVLDPVKFLANRAGICQIERDGRALYFDRHHLSIYGEMQLRPLFEPLFHSEAKIPVR
jgi:hypothetical protein